MRGDGITSLGRRGALVAAARDAEGVQRHDDVHELLLVCVAREVAREHVDRLFDPRLSVGEAVEVSCLVEIHVIGLGACSHAGPLLQTAPASAEIGLRVAAQPGVAVDGLRSDHDEVLGEGGVVGDGIDGGKLRRLILLRNGRVIYHTQQERQRARPSAGIGCAFFMRRNIPIHR